MLDMKSLTTNVSKYAVLENIDRVQLAQTATSTARNVTPMEPTAVLAAEGTTKNILLTGDGAVDKGTTQDTISRATPVRHLVTLVAAQ